MPKDGPNSILIIEDEQAVRISMSAYLEDCGFLISEAENGKVGLEKFNPETHDLILVDLRMPEVDGLEVLSRVSTEYPDTPVIVVSGNGEIGDVVHSLRLGAWDYIIKPIEDMAVLAYAIEKSLERVRLIKENKAYQEHLEQLVQKRTTELENANKELQTINIRLRKIVSITRFLSAFTQVEEFGSHFLEEIGQNMLAEGGSFYLAESGGLRLLYSLDPGHAAERIEYPIQDNTILKMALEQKKPVIIEKDDDLEQLKKSGWTKYSNCSVLALPLIAKSDELLGVVFLHCKEKPPFSEQDLEIGKILASYCSEALHAVIAVDSLRKSESKYRTLIEKTSEGYALLDLNGAIIKDVNSSLCNMLGYSEENLLEMALFDFILIEETPSFKDNFLKIMETGKRSFEVPLKHRDGSPVCAYFNFAKLPVNPDGIQYVFALISNISDVKMAEEALKVEKNKLKKSLEEKEILLQEVHHRVKNNLQVISSLIYLQHQKIGDPEVKQYLQTTENRVRAMAFIHEQLYQFKDFSKIEYSGYIRNLVEYLYESYQLNHGQIEIDIHIENLFLNLDTSIPLGLLINEIISNTFKYAFPDNRKGKIVINLQKHNEDGFMLNISDDGIGIPETVDMNNSESLGFKLIGALVNQLEGSMELGRQNGTSYRIIFSSI